MATTPQSHTSYCNTKDYDTTVRNFVPGFCIHRGMVSNCVLFSFFLFLSLPPRSKAANIFLSQSSALSLSFSEG